MRQLSHPSCQPLVDGIFIQSFQSQITLNFSLDPIPALFMDKEVGSLANE